MTNGISSKALRITLARAEQDDHARDLVIYEVGNGAAGLCMVIDELADTLVGVLEVVGGHERTVAALEERISLYLDVEAGLST